MADYRELLLRAVEALPENNGAARRQVYEKARSALVAQLRAINPPLPAREITQHRLQLEDCIRQVEQDATDQLLGSFRKLDEEADAAPAVAAQSAAAVAKAEPEISTTAGAPNGDEAEGEATAAPVAAEAGAHATPAARGAETDASDSDDAASADEPAGATEAPEADTGDDDPGEVEADTGKHEDNFAGESEAGDDDTDEGGDKSAPDGSASDGSVAALAAALEAHGATRSEPAPEPSVSEVVEPAAMGSRSGYGPVPVDADRTSSPATRRLEPKPGSIDYLIAQAQAAAEQAAIPTRWKNDIIAANRREGGQEFETVSAGAMPSTRPESASLNAAMSSVREVEVEQTPSVEPTLAEAADIVPDTVKVVAPSARAGISSDGDPQLSIDRAIETLDREARGEPSEADEDTGETEPETGEAVDEIRGRGGNAVTIFLVALALLLVAVCGAGYWAWREGYVDLDAMFGRDTVVGTAQPTGDVATGTSKTEDVPTLEAATDQDNADAGVSGPGNTTATPSAVASATKSMSDESGTPDTAEAAAPPADQPATAPADTTPAAATNTDATKIEDRLPTANSFADSTTATTAAQSPQSQTAAAASGTAAGATDQTAAAPDAGGQSLLLEASAAGTTGAVPFSGTVEWTRGTDERGEPTLEAHANIPARNLGVDVLIRRNADPTLPASELMEINFTVSDSFIGGDIASLPGVLLKNEELVKGTPLVGASARVVDNSFLFALSAADQDVATNTELLRSRKWMDLALVYGTGNRAIITLEKDAATQKMFEAVLADWATEAEKAAAAADASATGSN